MVSYDRWVEPVFRALADSTRRQLLDELFRTDGQSLTALAARFDMTRVAVAKHLGLLEAAGVVVSLIHDRWVSKYTEGWATGLVGLKGDFYYYF